MTLNLYLSVHLIALVASVGMGMYGITSPKRVCLRRLLAMWSVLVLLVASLIGGLIYVLRDDHRLLGDALSMGITLGIILVMTYMAVYEIAVNMRHRATT